MNLERNELQRDIERAAGDFLGRRWTIERVRALPRDPLPMDVWDTARELGWFSMLLPEARGGLALGAVELGVVFEAAGRTLFPGPLLGTAIAAPILHERVDLGSDARVVTLVAGPELVHLDARPSITLAGTRLRGSGQAGYADLSDWLVVIAAGRDGTVIVTLPTTASGVARRPISSVDVVDHPAQIVFEDAPAEVVARGRDARALIDRLATLLWSMQAARLLGAMTALLSRSVTYATIRHQFGRPIGAFQAIQHQLADACALVETTRSMCYLSQARIAGGDPLASRSARVAKGYASASARRVAESAYQVHGGIAFTVESDVHLFAKHCLTLQASVGDEAAHYAQLATMALDVGQAEVRPASQENERGDLYSVDRPER